MPDWVFWALIALAIMAALALLAAAVKAIGSLFGTGGGGGAGRPAAKQLSWLEAPDDFKVNTPTEYKVKLEQFNFGSQSYVPMNGSVLVGAVTPATVTIVSINGQPPGSMVSIPPGAGATGMAATASTIGGEVTFVLQGSQEEGQAENPRRLLCCRQ